MAERTWTVQQRQCIDARGGTVLVSAAAGSGKTSVLVQRVITRITDPQEPVDVDRLLVVTFTKAAAAEMKQRLASALTQLQAEHPDDRRLQRQQMLLPRANISTVHSFCANLLREYFHLLDLSPQFKVAEAAETALLREEALSEIAEECYREKDPVFLELSALLGSGRDVLYIAFSSGLSGTYQALSLMAAQLQEEFPERKIHMVDSLAASGGQGLLVWYAVQHARAGESIDQVRDWLEENKLHLAHWFTVDDLMFLFRGGRVSKTAAWAGTLLNIKPVLHVDDEGHLIPMEKVRGRKKSLNALIDHMEKSANKPISDQMVFITHGDCIEDAEYVAAKIKERFGVKEVVINYVDPVIGAHSGPGTMALFFLADKR